MENLRDGIILGCGNPLLDISANVDDEVLRKYDLKPDDAILAESKHIPLYSELIEKYKAEYIAGGSVQNSLRVCQWLLQRPNTSVFFGCVGKDEFSQILKEKAYTDGVNVQYQYTALEPTGTCGVLITGTHRSLCANLAAANKFTIDHLHKPENRKFLENAEFFYISGFFLTVSPPTIMAVAEHAYKHNRVFMMNLSAPFISKLYKQSQLASLPYVDILFGNKMEVNAFATEQGWNSDGTNNVREIGKKLLQWPKVNQRRPRIVVITQSQNPVLLITEDSIKEFPVKKLEPEEVTDTNGAGDAFVGGFLAQFIQKKSLDICIRSGIWAARHVIKRSGCTFVGKPDFDE